MTSDYYNRDGTPIGPQEYGNAFRANRRVALTQVTDRANPSQAFDVSTVFLVVDHSFGEGPPLIFESMAFPRGTLDEQLRERYSTESQAREGHAAMVREVVSWCTDPSVTNSDPRMLNQSNKETAPCSRDTPTAPDG